MSRTGWRLPPCGAKRAASKMRASTPSGTGWLVKCRQAPVVRRASLTSMEAGCYGSVVVVSSDGSSDGSSGGGAVVVVVVDRRDRREPLLLVVSGGVVVVVVLVV